MQIILTIPDNKLAEFRTGFLRKSPVPVDIDGNPEMTELVWLKRWIRYKLLMEYKRGKIKLAQDSIVLDDSIIE